MKKLLYIICIAIVALSCQRRALTYNYNPTVRVQINADWSDMTTPPTGMSVYCYPEDGGAPTTAITNIISSTTVDLREGVYNILVFNQIPSDYSAVAFEGMDRFETASVVAVSAATKKAITAKSSDDDAVRNPDEVAAATYLRLEISEEAVNKSVDLKSKGYTKAEELVIETISVEPQVVIKNTRVKLRITGVHNFASADAKLYGMATGYNFSQEQSHSTMTTHLLKDWTAVNYDYDRHEGEISINFSCFGLPNQSSSSVVEDYASWEGLLDIDITLVDLKTHIEESIPLNDKITNTTNEDDSSKADDMDMDMNIDINIDSGYGLGDGDDPITLPNVVPAGNVEGGFDATVDDWEDEKDVVVPV